NCATPRFAPSSSGGAGPVGVDYTVTEYRRVTTPEADEAPAPSSAAGPTFVECLFGTPGPARFSDGSIRNHRPCTQSPEAQRSLKAERVCGGLYGWREVSAQEYRDLCGGTPPTDAARPTASRLPGSRPTGDPPRRLRSPPRRKPSPRGPRPRAPRPRRRRAPPRRRHPLPRHRRRAPVRRVSARRVHRGCIIGAGEVHRRVRSPVLDWAPES